MFLSPGTIENLSILDLAAVAMAVNGRFDEKLGELKSAKEALDAKQLIVDTIEQAQKLLSDAQIQVTALDVRKQQADTLDASLVIRETTLQASLSDLQSREAVLKDAQISLAKATSDFAISQASAESSMTERENALKLSQTLGLQQLQSDREALDADRKAFNAKLAALAA